MSLVSSEMNAELNVLFNGVRAERQGSQSNAQEN